MDERLKKLVEEKPRNLLTLSALTKVSPEELETLLERAVERKEVHKFNHRYYLGEDVEPPDPDDYKSVKSFNAAWKRWEKKHPEERFKYMSE